MRLLSRMPDAFDKMSTVTRSVTGREVWGDRGTSRSEHAARSLIDPFFLTFDACLASSGSGLPE
jgi:hypothetical protein